MQDFAQAWICLRGEANCIISISLCGVTPLARGRGETLNLFNVSTLAKY